METNTGERPAVEPLYYFAVLSLMLLWLQGEKNQNIPQNAPQYRSIKTVWETQNMFSSSTPAVQMVYLNPFFMNPSVTSLGRDQFIYSQQPLLNTKNSHTGNASNLEPFQLNTSHNLESFQLNISPSLDSTHTWLSTTYSDAFQIHDDPQKTHTFSEVISIYPDRELFKKIKLPGCQSNDGKFSIGVCYLALIRLPLNECRSNSRMGCIQETDKINCTNQNCQPNDSPSWTCNAEILNSFEGSGSSLFCIELISSSDIESIFTYAKQRSRTTHDSDFQLNSSNCLNKITQNINPSLVAGKITSFCGDPISHVLTIDANLKRVYFAQYTTYKTSTENEYEHNDQKLKSPSRTNAHSNYKLRNLETTQSSKSFLDFPIIKFFSKYILTYFHKDSSLNIKEIEVIPNSNFFMDQRNLQSENSNQKSQPDLSMNTTTEKSSFCISAISLDPNFMDLTPCVNIAYPNYTSPLPIYILHESKSSKLAIFYFDQLNSLVLTVLSSNTLELEYSLKFNHFHSGWIFPFRNELDGYIMLIGEMYLTKQLIHAINLSKEKFQTIRDGQPQF